MSRRTLSVVLLAAVLAVPSVSSAQTRRTAATNPNDNALKIGGGAGFEFGFADDTGIGLRIEGVYPLRTLDNGVRLGIHGQLGYTFGGEEEFGVDVSYSAFKIVPALRASYRMQPNLDVYADAGLGLYFGSVSVDIEGLGDDSEGISGALMRLAAGALYDVSPQLAVGGELGLNPYFGDLEDASFSLFATVLYRL